MSVVVKICGLSTRQGIEAAVAAGADMVGFVFFEQSHRHLSPEEAAALAALVPAHVRKVALLVDPDDADVDAAIAAVRPDFLQLHGRESPQRAIAIRRRSRVGLIKALGVAGTEDLAGLGQWKGIADHLLIDAKPPPGAPVPGGRGQTFDWSLLDGRGLGTAFMLSGGLHPDNVTEAIARTRPWGVDVSSGVETDRVKDVDKIARFVAAARRTVAS